MLTKFKMLLIIAGIVLLVTAGFVLKFIYYDLAPLPTLFNPIGEVIQADSVNSIFAVQGKVYVITDSRNQESIGLISYLQIAENADKNESYSAESIVFDPKKYSVYGGITVANDGKLMLATRDLAHGGFAALVYMPDNIFESAFHYNNNKNATILQIYNGFYDSANFYFQVDYDSLAGGTLCKLPFGGAKPVCYEHDMPPLYTGDFFVEKGKVFYSNDGRLIALELKHKLLQQIGSRFKEISREIEPAEGMLAYYQNNVYIAARAINSKGTFMAVCHLPITSNHFERWKCSYDPDLPISNTANMSGFKIDQVTGNIIVALSNYDTNRFQLYSLPTASLSNK